MKKMKFNVGADAADAEAGQSNFYDGDVPPRGVYRFVVRGDMLRMKTNCNGDPMLSGLAEIREPKGSDKAKYNGYGMWFQQNVTKQGAPYVNNFLDTLGFNRKAFWGTGGVTIDENDADEDRNIVGTITKIGTKAVAEEIPCRIRTKRGKWDGEDRLEVAGAGYLALSAGDDEEEQWDGEEDEATDDSEPDVPEEEAEEVEDEADDEEEEEESDEEEFAREDLDGYSRAELKELLKEWNEDFKVLKRHSDDELREAIWAAMSSDEEDGDEEGDEEEDEEEEETPF